MRTIWKYELEVTRRQDIEMPKGSVILSLHVQGGIPCIWVECDPDAEKELRSFEIKGTGHAIEQGVNRRYIGSFQLRGGNYVGHLFELGLPALDADKVG